MIHAQPQIDGVDYPSVYRNLMVVGLLGSMYRNHEDAQLVGSAIELTLADPTQFRVCRSIAQGIGGDGEYATSTLTRHLDEHPDDDGAKVVLAVSLMLAGDPSWKALVDNVLATSSEQHAREAANAVIRYLTSLRH